MSVTPYIASWIALGVIVLALAGYRMMVAGHEDKTLHLTDKEATLVMEQTRTSEKIRTIDRWGQSPTVLAILCGVVIVGMYLYQVWQEGTKIQSG